MSTINYDSWAVDLADVGPVYPFQGWEVLMTILGVVFWLGWHWIQIKRESAHLESVRKLHDPAKVKEYLQNY